MERSRWAAAVALLVAVGFLGVWAGRTLFAPPAALPMGRGYALVDVVEGAVQRSLRLDVAAQWLGGTDVVNSASGVVTELRVADGERVAAGEVLYTVDLAPVVVAEGAVPAFRTMRQGDRGADVKQLQELLRGAGVRSASGDGVFGAVTAEQVRDWQQGLGQPRTGRVDLGRVVFVPRLPAVLAWGPEMTVGATMAPGTSVATLLPRSPEFSMVLPQNQLLLVDPGMPVEIRGPSSTWQARLGEIGQPGEDGSAVAAIEPAEDAKTVCGDECGQIPAQGSAGLPAHVTVVPLQEGPVVPTAALVVGADGTAAVVTEDGTSVAVQVLASAGGRAVVDGVEPGVRVRVPGDSEAGGS